MTTIGLLRIDLTLDSAGGVTAPEITETAVGLRLSRDRDGQVWTPPSSLAGSLRAHLGPDAGRWLGSDPPEPGRGQKPAPLEPSRVRFLGSRTTPVDDLTVRRSTAIDPVRGAAATATLHSAEMAPAGTQVSVFLRLDRTGAEELTELSTALAGWQPVIGRGRSTGHGQAHLTRIAWRLVDLRTRDGLRSWLAGGHDALFPAEDDGWDQVLPGDPGPGAGGALELRFTVASALHIGAGSRVITDTEESQGSRAAIVMAGGSAMVPASSWKGLLRARCGYILRSCGRPACLAPAADACGACTLCDLFGYTGRQATPGSPIGHVGRLAFHDSPVRAGVIGHRNHVGIDRFTGGARRAVLFADEVVTAGDVELHITTTDPTDELSPAERGLLLLAVRDLHDGLIGVGHGTTRGYGCLRLAGDSAAVLDELGPDHGTGAATRALLRGERP